MQRIHQFPLRFGLAVALASFSLAVALLITVNNATSAIYPEWQNSSQGPTCNCGVETAMAITNYADQAYYDNDSHNVYTQQSQQNTVDTQN